MYLSVLFTTLPCVVQLTWDVDIGSMSPVLTVRVASDANGNRGRQ
jgi:hypothetical protein